MSKLISIPDNKGNTVLFWAAQFGRMDVLRLLVVITPIEELYSYVLVTDDDDDTAIHCATRIYKVEIVMHILRVNLIYRTCRKILRSYKKCRLNKIHRNFCKLFHITVYYISF